MKKRKFEFPKFSKEFVTEKVAESAYDIDIKRYLSQEDVEIILGAYIDIYFYGGGRFEFSVDPLGAKWILDLALIDRATSLDISLKRWNKKNAEGEQQNEFLQSAVECGIVRLVKENVENYPEFISLLEETVSAIEKERNSIRGIWNNLQELLLDEEKMQGAVSQLKELEETMKDSSLSGLLKEAQVRK